MPTTKPRLKPLTVTTKAALARAVDRTRQALEAHYEKPGFPGGRSGPWPVAKVLEFLSSLDPKNAGGKRNGNGHANGGGELPDGMPNNTATLQTMLLAEQIRQRKLKNDRDAGLLVSVEQVRQEAAELVLYVRNMLEEIPERLEMELPAENRAEIKTRLQDAIYQILRGAAAHDFTKRTETRSDDERTSSPAGQATGEPSPSGVGRPTGTTTGEATVDPANPHAANG